MIDGARSSAEMIDVCIVSSISNMPFLSCSTFPFLAKNMRGGEYAVRNRRRHAASLADGEAQA